MNPIHPLAATAVMIAFTSCSTTKPASDLSGAGFVQETPNAWSRKNIPVHDRELAEQIVVNREACKRAPLCRK